MCYGIEIGNIPSAYAQTMQEEFIFWANFIKKSYSPFEIYHDSFLNPVYIQKIIDSNFLFINNLAFRDVDEKLKKILCLLKVNTIIVSVEPYRSKRYRPTERNKNELASILKIDDSIELEGACSWCKSIKLYVQLVERKYENEN
jgi:hypothetical protein